MGKISRTSRCLVLVLAFWMLLSVCTLAAEDGAVWACSSTSENGVTVSVCTDTTVSSGVITVTYDSKTLKFSEAIVDSNYVFAHSINARVPGTIQISWIAPGAYTAEECLVLMQLCFEGQSAESVNLSGAAYNAEGEPVAVTALDYTALNTALAEVESKLVQDYTAQSFDAMLDAEKEARELLKQALISPKQLAAAAEKLTEALAKLEPIAPPTQTATQPTTLPGTAPQGGNGWIGIVVAAVAVCAAVAVAVVVILKKRGNK